MHTRSRLETHFSGASEKSQPFRICDLFPWRIPFLFGRALFRHFFINSDFDFYFESACVSQYLRATIERRPKIDTLRFFVVFRMLCIIRLRSSMINGSRCATTLYGLDNIAANMIYDLENCVRCDLWRANGQLVCIQSIDLDNEKSIHQCTHVNGTAVSAH